MTSRSYKKSTHRFFDELIGFVAGITGIGLALELQSNSAGTVLRYSANDYITLVGNVGVSGIEMRLYPFQVLETLSHNGWPQVITFDVSPINSFAPMHQIQLTGLQGVHGSMISSAFVRYYESNKSFAIAKYGKATKNWSEVWKFGRAIRNALAHNGAINIDDTSAPPVMWRGLSYSHRDNGKAVLYCDITAVELILLMEELDTDV